jgi:hypothetical protein
MSRSTALEGTRHYGAIGFVDGTALVPEAHSRARLVSSDGCRVLKSTAIS